MLSVFVAPYLNNIYSIVSWYILIDREFCILYIDAVNFFKIKFFISLGLLLYDVVKRFSANFSLRIQIEPRRCRNSSKK